MKHYSFSVALPIGITVVVGLVTSALASLAQTAAGPNHHVIVAESSALGQRLAHDVATNGDMIVTLNSPNSPVPKVSNNAVDRSLSAPQTIVNIVSFPYHSGASAQRYFITDLGTLGGTESFAYALNDSGQVVGTSRISGDVSTHSFLYTDGKMTDLYPLNSQDIQTVGPTGINNAGQIASGIIVNGVYVPAILDSPTGNLTLLGSLGAVTDYGFSGVATSINNEGNATGYSYIDNLNRHGFLYRNNVMTDIGSFGGYSSGWAINDENEIAGFASATYNGVAHAFVYIDGVMTDLDPVTESYAKDVNNQGHAVGQFLTADGTAFHAFLYSQGNFTDITPAGGPEAIANGVNNAAQVVGSASFANKVHAFFYDNGEIVDLNSVIPRDSGWELTLAVDLNNHGQITGYGSVNNKSRAYLLTPVISTEQCKDDAWMRFGFKNQGQCIRYVNTGN